MCMDSSRSFSNSRAIAEGGVRTIVYLYHDKSFVVIREYRGALGTLLLRVKVTITGGSKAAEK